MTTAVRRVRQEPLAEDGSESPGFTPSVASTSSDLSAKLGQLNIPKLIERLAEVDLEEEGRDEEGADEERGTATDFIPVLDIQILIRTHSCTRA